MSVQSDSRECALVLLQRFSSHPSAYLILNDDIEHFVSRTVTGLVPYGSVNPRHAVHFGELIAPSKERAELLSGFLRWCHDDNRRVSAVQLRLEDASIYAERGFVVNQLGSSYAISLTDYGLKGRRFVKTRNMISRAKRAGSEVVEVSPGRTEVEYPADELDRIDREWLRAKGRRTRELRFMVGQRGGQGERGRRTFISRNASQINGYVTFSPVYGDRPGWLYDLTRRSTHAVPGTTELTLWSAIQQFQAEGASWLHLGFTPFAGLHPAHEVRDAASPSVSRLIRLLYSHGRPLYPSASQEAFKRKWHPDIIEPEYIALDGLRPGIIWHLLRLTRAL